jgi:hypothetical protein
MHPVTSVIAIMRVMRSGRVDGITQHVQHCPLAGHG